MYLLSLLWPVLTWICGLATLAGVATLVVHAQDAAPGSKDRARRLLELLVFVAYATTTIILANNDSEPLAAWAKLGFLLNLVLSGCVLWAHRREAHTVWVTIAYKY